MKGRERSILELREPAAELELERVVLRHSRSGSTDRSANQFTHDVVEHNGLGPMKTDVGDRLRPNQSSDPVCGDRAERERRFVEVREVVEEVASRRVTLNARRLCPPANAFVERADRNRT